MTQEKKESAAIKPVKMRYVERLNLNRKGHSATFKSVTRMRREANDPKEQVPPMGHYTPKYEIRFNRLGESQGKIKDIKGTQAYRSQSNAERGVICIGLM